MFPQRQNETERLRQALLDEIYAGAFGGGMQAMLQAEDDIQNADHAELEDIAQRYGLR